VDEQVYLVYCDGTDERRSHDLRKFVQHTGCGISSRHAEDLLMQNGLRETRFQEARFSGNALTKVEAELAGQIGCRISDVLVCASGMNAFYAGFRSVQEFQAGRGRRTWVQLGWLYLDSGKILEQFLAPDETLECIYDVFEVDAVLARIEELGDTLAAVVVECPSNPLIRVCELERVAEAVRAQGGVMIVDPTIASVYNVDVLAYADLLVTSLTKYAAIEGDVMIGALAVNPESPYYGDLVLRTSSFHVPPYVGDLARLAHEMDTAPEVIDQMNANAARLCAFLRKHPAVKKIYCAGCSDHIETIAKGDDPVGAVISVELVGDMEKFYDAVRLMKGPSFGTRYTLLCPFMYLAHYDLVTSEKGRAFLSQVGIDPELIRISVGQEPYEAIEAVFAEALDPGIKPVAT
jgi:cystathionine gamma-synthase